MTQFRPAPMMVVPADVFDDLLARLHQPPRPLAPALARALAELPDTVTARAPGDRL